MANTVMTDNVKPGQSIGATNDSWVPPTAVRQVALQNRHATQILYGKIITAESKAAVTAAAATAIAANAITATGDGCFAIPPANVRRIVFRSGRPVWTAILVLGSGAATVFDIEATIDVRP